jgi:hypothetical protein
MSPGGAARGRRAGFVQVDQLTGEVLRIVPLQYNPPALVEVTEGESARLEIVAEFDAAEEGAGVDAQLAAVRAVTQDADGPRAPFTVLVWGARVQPVALVSLTITEHAFDADLNPIRATAAIVLRSLSTNEAAGTAPELIAAFERRQAELADQVIGTLSELGLKRLG